MVNAIVSESKIYAELDKYIKNIKISIVNEFDTYCIYADYEYAHCRIQLNHNYLSKDFEPYLKATAREIVNLISYEYFYTKTYKEEK